ncbi:hypothetical protein HDU98_003878 [Podochytrium sp. JEL0797]|nr:hypothetical protein HDU98_003878 [Podochytrium sp. JEL0797]
MFSRRLLSTSTSSSAKPRSSLVGSLFGFAVGASLVGFASYTSLVDEYRRASFGTASSLHELQKSVSLLAEKEKRVDQLEKEVAVLRKENATQKDVDDLKNRLLKVTDDITRDHLDLKQEVWEIKLANKK